ncbi:MAG TPA: hemolysin family protein [Planctomycetaceae bacterium]|nr:hemolysin family protein [Planctomycetaceae bacterium]
MQSLFVWEILVVLLLIVVNGFLSGSEIAVISANRGRLRQWADAGNLKARLALDLAQDPKRFLPAVQVAISLAGTFAAVLAGAAIVEEIEQRLANNPIGVISAWRFEIALAFVAALLSFCSLMLGELLPKRLSVHKPAALACMAARPLDLLSRVAQPIVWCLGKATDKAALVFGVRQAQVPGISLQEIRHLIEMGTAEGIVDPVEQKLAFEALQLGDRTVRQIMKPRIDIDAVDVETPQEELLGVLAMAGFSRLPVYEGDLDHIIGFVHLKDVLRQHYLGWKLDLRKLVRPALTVPDTMRLDQLLVRFQEQRNQLAVVVDEYGATRGMVTLEDVIEELVGELLTEHHERVEQQIVARDATSWLVDGSVSIADLLERLGRYHLANSAPRHVSSVGGLVVDQLGHLPAIGERTTWHDLSFEVVALENQRIERVLVKIERGS